MRYQLFLGSIVLGISVLACSWALPVPGTPVTPTPDMSAACYFVEASAGLPESETALRDASQRMA